ncbi:hypothetical protein M3Y94_00936400 [Aphelenchoides besseyi]|nr:hypothetical protein M3Y94_00936400 [Aphelenchoides besseyi]KAI6224944.1 hypothetical protein M3Y95_00805800 [Aphelenchoides besseyi]
MLSKLNDKFVVKTPPIPFAVAVQRRDKLGCKIKLNGAAKSGRGFGVSFNEDDRVVFRLYFDLTYKRLHLCRNDDQELVDSLACGFDFYQLFKMKISLDQIFNIKIKNGPTFSISGITSELQNVNLICVHGNVVMVKTQLQKFVISADDGGIRSQFAPQTQLQLPAVPPPYNNQLPIYSGVIIEDKDGHNQQIL